MPPVDIYQTGDQELVLKAELPDMTREDIDIHIENFVLTIKGEKKVSTDVKEEQFHRVERRYGTFSRSFSLPQTVDPNRCGRVQERRPDRAAAAARGGQAAADQGRRRGLTAATSLGQAGRAGRWVRTPTCPTHLAYPPYQPHPPTC